MRYIYKHEIMSLTLTLPVVYLNWLHTKQSKFLYWTADGLPVTKINENKSLGSPVHRWLITEMFPLS
jgi:hypothetical protein